MIRPVVPDLFRDQAAKYPDNVAVKILPRSLSYAELDHQSDVMAAKLISMGVRPNDFVAVVYRGAKSCSCRHRHPESQGCLCSMDSDYSHDRLLYKLENSRSAVLVTERELYQKKQGGGYLCP
jgi:non-ribosomal peptide synthetase component F